MLNFFLCDMKFFSIDVKFNEEFKSELRITLLYAKKSELRGVKNFVNNSVYNLKNTAKVLLVQFFSYCTNLNVLVFENFLRIYRYVSMIII